MGFEEAMNDWRLVLGVLLESIRSEALTDELANRRARALLLEPVHGMSQDESYEAVRTAMQSAERLTDLGASPIRHPENEFRSFLAKVRQFMDMARPWPEPPFTNLDRGSWRYYSAHRVVARIHSRQHRLEGLLRDTFHHVEDTSGDRFVLVLRLNSGDEVAVATSFWRASRDLALLQHDDSDRHPRQILDAFLAATGLAPEEATPTAP